MVFFPALHIFTISVPALRFRICLLAIVDK